MIRRLWRWVCAQGCLLRASPLGFYQMLGERRDWIAAKAVYLQEESGKWKALFSTVKAPYSFLRMMGLSPQMAIGLLAVGSTVTTGVVVNETVFSERSFSRGDAGVFDAPEDIPVSYSEADNTLRLNFRGVPIGEVVIEDITLGTVLPGSTLPQGVTSVVSIGGRAASGGFTETFLEVGDFTVDRWRCNTFLLENSEIYELTVQFNASDGQSISPEMGTPRARAIGGGDRAKSMNTSGGTYDHLVLDVPTSGVNGQVDKLRLSNIFTKGGACKLSRIKAGTLLIEFMETGAGDGLAVKDFIIATSTVYKIYNNKENRDVLISPP